MSKDNEYLQHLIHLGTDKVSRIVPADLSNENDQRRLKEEVRPIVNQLKTVMSEVADTIANNKGDEKALIRKLHFVFVAHDCNITFDEDGQYTDEENPASLRFVPEKGKIELKVSPIFRDSQDLRKNYTYLKELIHELSALLLVQQLAEMRGVEIKNNETLTRYKSLLSLEGGDVSLTHIVDAILLALIESYKEKP